MFNTGAHVNTKISTGIIDKSTSYCYKLLKKLEDKKNTFMAWVIN